MADPEDEDRWPEEAFHALLEAATVIVYHIDLAGRFTYLNAAAASAAGYAVEELVGRYSHDLVRPDYREHVVWLYRGQLRERLPGTYFEFPCVTRDGRELWVGQNVQLLHRHGEPVGLHAVARDITDRRELEQELERSECYYRTLIERSLDVIHVINPDGTTRYISPAVERLLGLTPAELRGAPASELAHPEDLPAVVEAVRELRGSGSVATTEARVRHRDGSWRVFEMVLRNLVDDPDVAGVVINSRDITERRLADELLRHHALHDALTGLPDRHLFMERLAHAIRRSRRRRAYSFAVLFLDLGRFKVVNDSLGHQAGDELLIAVAQRLQECLRTEDTVARLGGDEFAILLEDIGGVDDATRVAERIQAALNEPVVVGGFEVFTSASIGISLTSHSHDSPDELLRNADMAMYRAKSSGAQFEVFDRTMHAAALTRLHMETDLRRALERGEFQVHYQPIVSLANGGVRGVEARVCWMHPERGWLAPDDFVPVAEETGVILGLGEWVLGEACRQLRAWQDLFPDLPPLVLEVKLSARQLAQPGVVEQIDGVVERAGLRREQLRLEIRESALLPDAEAGVRVLERLKRLGVQISLDDFGTGYSSLSYLHRFPLDALKIDRSFVRAFAPGDRSAQLVHTILALGRSLGVAVLADGVETPEQLRVLRELGCEMGQGSLFAPPAAPTEVEAILARAAAGQPLAVASDTGRVK